MANFFCSFSPADLEKQRNFYCGLVGLSIVFGGFARFDLRLYSTPDQNNGKKKEQKSILAESTNKKVE
jgi:hypothetical protein